MSVHKFFVNQVGPAEYGFEEALASCVPILEKSGLTYVVHDGGFTIDADWQAATDLIGLLHQRLHDAGFERVHSDIRIGTRTDKAQTMQDKVDTVERQLAFPEQ